MQSPTTDADARRDDEALTAADLISAYENDVEELRLAGAGVAGEQLRSRPVSGKWSTLEVVCHVADCEQLPGAAALPGLPLGRRTRPGGRDPASDGPHVQAGRPRRLTSQRRPQRSGPG